MWVSNYCFGCIFQHNNVKTKAKSVKYYIIRFSPKGTLDIFEKINDIDFLIQSLVDIVKKQFQSKDVEYCIKFICCSSNLSNAGRQKVMAMWYKSLDPAEKGKLLSHRAEWYKSLDPKEKEKLLSKSADWYKLLGSAEKQNLLSSRAIWYKSLDTAQKQKRAEWFNSLNSAQKQKRAEWYKSLNPEEKEKLLSGRAEWYKTLDPADKDKITSQVQANKETHRNLVQLDLDQKITAFQSKIREGSYYIFSVCNRILYYTILNFSC